MGGWPFSFAISLCFDKRYSTDFHIVDIGLDFGTCRVNELLLPKALVLRLQDPAFAPSPVRQNSSTMGRSGVWLSEAIFYACHKEHLPDTGRLFLVSPLGITTLGPDCHSQNNCRKSLRQYRPSGTVENSETLWHTSENHFYHTTTL